MSEDPGFGRVLGLDLGSKRIGVAVCDAGRMVATPYETVRRVGDRPVEHQQIAAIVAETDAVLLLVGLPLSLDGSVGQAAKTVLSEVRALRRRLNIPVDTHDERLSTVTADDYLSQQRVRGNKRRDVVDQVAAAVILQSWIDGAVLVTSAPTLAGGTTVRSIQTLRSRGDISRSRQQEPAPRRSTWRER